MFKRCSLILVCLFFLSFVRCDENIKTPDGMIIKLHRQKKTSFEQHLNNMNLLNKIGINTDWLYKKPHKNNSTNDSVALYRYLDNEFYGKIVIGHPGQTLNVGFDTAWTLSWVISAECSGVFTDFGCLFHNKYDHTKSSEYRKDGRTIKIPQGKYELSGYYSYDNISFGHTNVSNFSFAEMNKVPSTMLFSKLDGVLGLGLKGDSYEPFFYNLVRTGKIKDAIFCVYLNRDKQSMHGGNVILGFIEKRHIHHTRNENNETIYDEPIYMPVKSGYTWHFDLDSFYVNLDKESPLEFCTGKNCTAITDTGANDIIGPADDVNEIHKAIGAKSFFLNRYRINCDTINKLPEIAFTIAGQNFTLKGRDYTVKLSYFSITICLSAFVPEPTYKNYWVLGGAFLSEYYTIYKVEDKQIGFVKAA